MKQLFLVLVLALVLSPLAISVRPQKLYIPPQYSADFEPQVASFIQNGESRGVVVDMSGLIMRFTDMFEGTPVLGVCVPNEVVVLISQSFWNKADPAEREFLIWHELGHCILGREHSTWMHEGYPVSIMYPVEWATNHEDYYYTHRNELIDELYKPFMAKLHEINITVPAVSD
jgi:hypothetical protein